MRPLPPLAALLAIATTLIAAEGIPDDRVGSWTDTQVQQRQPRPNERRIDEIGWASDLRTARRLAQEHRRPVFVFTMDGHIQIGRC